MKAVTEFASFTLAAGLKMKADLTAEGKSPEDVLTALGEKFKYAEEKLKYFGHALEIASANQNNLRRVMVMSIAEGESAPAKATQFEDHYYLPEMHVEARKPAEAPSKDAKGGRGGGGRGGPGGKGGGNKDKESPWGLSPEQKAAKKGAGAANKAAKA